MADLRRLLIKCSIENRTLNGASQQLPHSSRKAGYQSLIYVISIESAAIFALL